MLRAHVPVRPLRLKTSKSARCVVCGAEVIYLTRPPKYCDKHVRKSSHFYSQSRYQKRKLARAMLAAPETVELIVDTPPAGFCRECGRIRLSSADVGGVCMWCAEDAILTPARMVVD